jgi:D-alanyl-D-alanine carboxypeptidase (penicillin-binding protein 5/6)
MIEYTAPLPAPVVRGTTVGRVSVTGAGVPDLSIPLLAGADVGRQGLTARAMTMLGRMVGG